MADFASTAHVLIRTGRIILDSVATERSDVSLAINIIKTPGRQSYDVYSLLFDEDIMIGSWEGFPASNIGRRLIKHKM